MAPQPPLAPASKPPLGGSTIRYTLRLERLRPTAHTSGLVLKTPLLGRWVTSLSLIGRRNRAGAWQTRLFLCPHALCVCKNRNSRQPSFRQAQFSEAGLATLPISRR